TPLARRRSSRRVRTVRPPASGWLLRDPLVSADPWCSAPAFRFTPAGRQVRSPFLGQGLPEPVAGAVQQHAQVLTVDAHAAADLVLVALLEEDQAQQVAILRRQRGDDAPHKGKLTFADQGGLDD